MVEIYNIVKIKQANLSNPSLVDGGRLDIEMMQTEDNAMKCLFSISELMRYNTSKGYDNRKYTPALNKRNSWGINYDI